jgi:lipopolysaccharide/colanic/teichoic acid biosynthesis glycosyltransferase
MLLLRLTGDGEVFYLQERVGYKNRKFRIIKFATMVKDGDKIGNGEFTVKNDPRLRPFGKVLRKTKLNELPQIINILKSDMTLIGPRPLMDKGFERYSREVQNIIYNIRPGLTGIGSIIFRDEETIVSHFTDLEKVYRNINRYKGQLEIWYQKKQSFKTDMLIVFLTVYSIVFPTQHITFDVFKDLPVIEKDELNLSVMLFRNRPIAKKVERRSPVAM